MNLTDALKAAWQYAGQIPAGVVQGTLADSHIQSDVARRKAIEAKNNETYLGRVANAMPDPISLIAGKDYRPAIIDQVPAMYGLIKSIVSGKAPEAGGMVANAMDRTGAAIDRTNKTLHIKDPENAVQTALNIAGSLAVPGPKLPAVTATSLIGKAAQKTARVAAETALPMRNTGVKTALATQVPLGVGIREGVDAIAPSDDYSGTADAFRMGHDPLAALDPVDPLAALDNNDPLSGLDTGIVPTPADQQEASLLEKGALGALAVASAGLSFSAGRAALARIKAGPINPGELVGSRIIKSNASTADKAVAGIVQHDQIARNAANDYLSPDQAAQFNYNSDRIIPQALGAKVKNALVTGELPGSVVRAKPLAPLLNAVATDLDPSERAMLADGLLARSALDDYNATGVQSAFNDKTPHELNLMGDVVDNDPKLRKYADAVRDQYKSLLDYRRDQGFLSSTQYQDMLTKRPNYVHMSRDITREGGPNSLFGGAGSSNPIHDEMYTRQLEEFGGVQAGATRDPIDELQSRYVATIRASQMNVHKRDFFDGLMNSSAVNDTIAASDGTAVKFITKLAEEPKSPEGVHTVWRDGRPEYYKVGDPSLDRALRYSPRQTAGALGTMRQIGQFFTTGAGNPLSMFGATVSPVYDTLTGMVLRPQGTDLGVINEALNRFGSPVNLGRLDPTSVLTAPIGALRSMKDELTGALANNLSTQILRDHGLVFDALGPQKTTAFRDFLQSKYDSSIRSMLDEQGVSSHQQWGADNGRDLPIGLNDVAPAYAANLSSRATAEALSGNHTFLEGMLARGGNVFAQAKASTISRMYSAVIRNMQEGFKYQFAATNLPKVKSMADLNELMSTTRRVSTDSGQFGGNDQWNKLADSIMYANVGTQAIGEWARRFAKSPIYTTSNLITTIGTLAALRYGAMISDPDVRDKVNNRTDQQNVSSIPTFGGIDIPVEPNMRMLTGPLFAALDHIAMDEQGNFHPNFVNAIYDYFDDDAHSANHEEMGESVKNSFLAGLQSVNPVNPGSMPAVAGGMAYYGIDPGMTRISGNAAPAKIQQQSELAGNGKYTDSLVSGYFSNLINSMVGSGVTNLIDVADQWQRAAYSQNRDGSRGTSPAGAAKVALSALIDNASKTTGPVQGMLFKDYEKPVSIADTDYTLFQHKSDGIDKATKIFRDDIKNAFVTGSDPRTALLEPHDLVPPDYANTPLAPIGAISLQLQKQLTKLQTYNKSLIRQQDTVRNQKVTKIEERNKQLNEITKKRRYLYTKMLQITRQAEEAIGQSIGDDHFTFQNFDPEQYSHPQQ